LPDRPCLSIQAQVSAIEQPEYDAGSPGASARREYDRRRTTRERRVRAQHPHIGGLLLALRDPPTHEAAWARGARGEESVAHVLAKHLDPGVVVLHDRRIPRSRANIDHIAVAPSGVWVIDAKRYQGKVAISRPLLGDARLTIAGRDRTKLVDGVAAQVALVEAALRGTAPAPPVRGALCFVDADLPLLGTLSFNGHLLLHPKPLAKRINADGALTGDEVRAVAARLAARFPAA
jgi:hypothetical protein